MKERGILMTPENYGKCEDGSKIQTRRIIEPQPEGEPRPLSEWSRGIARACHDHDPDHDKLAAHTERLKGKIFPFTTKHGGLMSPKCPYGGPGDRLYVKESHYSWGRWDLDGFTKKGRQKYRFRRTTTEIRYRENPPTKYLAEGKSITSSKWHKRSALFMEKKDARLWLELTEVRVERIQEISLLDVGAEGYAISVDGGSPSDFAQPWNRINGDGAWERNDWVWVLSLKKVKP